MLKHPRTVKVFKKVNAKKIESMPLKDAKTLIVSSLNNLKDKEDYLGKDCVKLLQALFLGCTGPYGGPDQMFKTCNDSYKFGDLLAELGFPDIAVKIYKQINHPTALLNEVIKRIWKLTTYLCYCFTVHSKKLSMFLGDAGAVEQLTEGINFICRLKVDNNLDQFNISITSMGILYNIAKFTENRCLFQQAKTFQLIMKLKDAGISCIANSFTRILLPYIVDEDEYDIIADTIDLIGEIIYLLRGSFKRVKSGKITLVDQMTSHTFKPWEFIRCLCKLAVNDSNKAKIIEKGVLSEFAKVFSRNDAREVRMVTECLWTLSFDSNVCQAIKDAPGIISALENLKDSEDAEISKNVSGTQWMINGKNETEESQVFHIDGDRHIFISYSWAEKDIVKMIYTRLKDLGYKIWINWDVSTGSTPQEMAQAVDNASVVFICMSEKYKQSPNCRLEAEYIYKKRIEYIPLIVQDTYDPDGWLRVLTNTKFCFDFSSKYPFHNKIQELVNELKRCLGRKQVQEHKSMEGADKGTIQKSILCEIL